MRYSTVGQEQSKGLWESLTGKVDQFRRQYAEWNSTGRQDLPALEQTLTRAKADLAAAAQRAYQRGDVEGMRALNARVTEADALLRDLATVQGTVSRWQGTWDLLSSWLTQAQWEYGTIGIGALPLLAPVAIATAAAAVGALAWVINTWQTLRTRAAVIKDLADRVAAGQLTPEQARALAESATPPPLFGLDLRGIGGAAIIGGLALLALMLWRR